MITEINLNNVGSYKSNATLVTDKKLNLIYGLNGTGKSIFSNYLFKRTDDEKFEDCSVEGLSEDHEILVYNQTFIRESFFESTILPGIFTLSKENKEAKIRIANAEKEKEKLEEKKGRKAQERENENESINEKFETAKNVTWEIKSDYSGGDRVLEFCLAGLKNSKDNLFNYLVELTKPTDKPARSIAELKDKLQAISGEHAQKYSLVPEIIFSGLSIETEKIFAKKIVGNKNSNVSELITQLGNSDWVKSGLKYLPEESSLENKECPFCQEKTVSNTLVKSIKDYFDESYELDIKSLEALLEKYSQAIHQISNKTTPEANPEFEAFKKDFEIKFTAFNQLLESNKKKIEEKIKNPSTPLVLEGSAKSLEEINEVINKINVAISEHNKNIEEKEFIISKITDNFWQIMRWNYDQIISSYLSDAEASKAKLDSLNLSIENFDKQIFEQNSIISEQQKETVNIGEAIANINTGLSDLGITDFKIENHTEENFYKIVRGGDRDGVFRSLSEGEKMIISFLYFLEMCKGKQNATDTNKKKIIIIDDPISSLSHIYIFNIGRLIKNEFFGKKETKKDEETGEKISIWNYKYEQVFILTHSLYFFYEITETKKNERKETQKLFRLIKNKEGSCFQEMNYEEIQNDYQAYWSIIKDDKQPPALIANCMRNVIEYFFNFVEKKDLNNFFRQEPLNTNRFQAFYRYINRESHSLGQNIFDFKEFNYDDFRDGFEEVFKATKYEEHYKKMMK